LTLGRIQPEMKNQKAQRDQSTKKKEKRPADAEPCELGPITIEVSTQRWVSVEDEEFQCRCGQEKKKAVGL